MVNKIFCKKKEFKDSKASIIQKIILKKYLLR